MQTHRTRTAAFACAILAFVSQSGTAATMQMQDDDVKHTFALSCVPKGGLTDDDREIVAEYLARIEDDLAEAPSKVARLAAKTRIWTPACAAAAQPVPKSLARRISTPAFGTERFIFDRALVIVDSDTNRILDRVDAHR